MIEVEKRAFIDEQKYHKLLTRFKEKLKTSKQITYYFTGDKDFRLMMTPSSTKIWLKEGQIHDDFRKENEVFINQDNKSDLLKMLSSLGYTVDIKWYRVRNETVYEDISIAIDYTQGYGYIFEAELLVENETKIEAANLKIEALLKELDINLSDKSDFKIKYKDYQEKWLQYTKEINEVEFLK